MNHAITLGGLLLFLACVGGFVAAAFGALMTFAGGMSDAPAQGSAASSGGCLTAVIGAAVFGASLWGLLS